jgi:uncharacterized protein involved in exopolysaccharide biosynthesis
MNDAVIAALGTALVAILARVTELVIVNRRSRVHARKVERLLDQEVAQGDTDFISDQYRKLITQLRRQMSTIQTEVKNLRDEHIQCVTENAQLKERLETLERKIGDSED